VTVSHPTTGYGLAGRRLGTGALTIFLISASGPMTVLVGGVVTTFAVTGVVGAPLSFPLLAVALALFSVGYAAMSRYMLNAGGFYPYVAQGLGRGWGVAASFVALLAYSSIQTGLFGLFGVGSADFAARHLHVQVPWWVGSSLALAAVAVLGVRKVDLNAKVLSALLTCEVGAMLLFDAGSFSHPAGGSVSFAGLMPHNLLVPGVGGVFAFGVASYLGFEQGAVYSEESRDPRRTVAHATYTTVAVIGVLYTISAWALAVGVGSDRIVARAKDPASGIPFSLLADDFGVPVATAANVLLLTSVFACMLSIHNCVARYVFAMSRDRVLPVRLVRTGKGSAAPVAGSLIQSLAAAVTVLVFAVLGRDPLTELFTWLSYVGAVGVLLLMTATSLAVVGFFRRRPELPASRWQRVVAPLLATASLTAVTVVTVGNADAVLGTERGSVLAYVLPGLAGLAAVGGLGWGLVLRRTRPDIYRRGGPARVPDATPDAIGDGFADVPAPTGRRPVPRVRRAAAGDVWRRLHALYLVRRLRPLWREIQGAVPEVALLPRYRGLAALRSTVRHAPLAVIRMQVEILDGYAALAPWMSTRAQRLATVEARRRGLTGTRFAVTVEAAVLGAAIDARGRVPPTAGRPASDAVPALFPVDTPAVDTLTRLVQVGRALRRSPVVFATRHRLAAAPSLGYGGFGVSPREVTINPR